HLWQAPFTLQPNVVAAIRHEAEIARAGRKARIVVNERTGAIVMGGDVRVEPVAVSRGGMDLIVSGNPYPNGVQLTRQDEKKPTMQPFSGASVQEIMDALNAMGASTRDIVAILEALRDSGALHAELIVQ
ncbi:MAG TPA: flagellar basal body P-ring protein FlgI, partial [Leptospiraceae bacterium]|nr:flagellar basal body P-ring protein FlgI [Leptospiraceae bacterium]